MTYAVQLARAADVNFLYRGEHHVCLGPCPAGHWVAMGREVFCLAVAEEYRRAGYLVVVTAHDVEVVRAE